MRTTATTVAAVAAAVLSTSAMADFGLIPVPMTSGTGVGTDGYFNSGYTSSIGALNIGIKAHEYRNGNMPAGSTTQSSVSGGGTWLNVDSQNRYTAIAGVAANKPSWNPAAPSWGFTWSIASDPGSGWGRPNTGAYLASMTITRPDAVAVNLFSDQDAGGFFGSDPTNKVWQNNWNLGYLGVFGNGVDANTQGEWKIRISVKANDGSGNYSAIGSQEITVNVTPVPGAAALLGVAGLMGRRRRA
jgi:hypothetical protein